MTHTTLGALIKDPEAKYKGSGNVSKVFSPEEEEGMVDHIVWCMEHGAGMDIIQVSFTASRGKAFKNDKTYVTELMNSDLRLSWTIMDYHGLSWTIMDYHGLSWTIMDYHGLLKSIEKKMILATIYGYKIQPD